MSKFVMDGKFRVIGYFWDYPTMRKIRKEIRETHPDKKLVLRFELLEDLEQ